MCLCFKYLGWITGYLIVFYAVLFSFRSIFGITLDLDVKGHDIDILKKYECNCQCMYYFGFNDACGMLFVSFLLVVNNTIFIKLWYEQSKHGKLYFYLIKQPIPINVAFILNPTNPAMSLMHGNIDDIIDWKLHPNSKVNNLNLAGMPSNSRDINAPHVVMDSLELRVRKVRNDDRSSTGADGNPSNVNDENKRFWISSSIDTSHRSYANIFRLFIYVFVGFTSIEAYGLLLVIIPSVGDILYDIPPELDIMFYGLGLTLITAPGVLYLSLLLKMFEKCCDICCKKNAQEKSNKQHKNTLDHLEAAVNNKENALIF